MNGAFVRPGFIAAFFWIPTLRSTAVFAAADSDRTRPTATATHIRRLERCGLSPSPT
jgi:hypothetical protein